MKRIFLIAFACILVLVGCASNTLTWQEQYDLGIRYLNEGNYNEAIICFTAAIEIDEKNTSAYISRAHAFLKTNQMEKALTDYEKVIEIDNTITEAYTGIADIYYSQNEYEKANDILEKAEGNVAVNSDELYNGKVVKIYSVDGEKVINIQELEEYLSNEWYLEPVCLMYAADGRTRVTLISEIEAYKNVGWYSEPVVTMYSPDGRTIVILKSEVETYKNVGWYTEPVCIMYALDGRTRITLISEVEEYKKVGWYTEPMCIMYSSDGRTIIVKKTEIDAYKAVGWSTEPFEVVGSYLPELKENSTDAEILKYVNDHFESIVNTSFLLHMGVFLEVDWDNYVSHPDAADYGRPGLYKVIEKGFDSVEDIKAYLNNSFSKSYIEGLNFTNYYEINGNLYANIKPFGMEGFKTYHFDTIVHHDTNNVITVSGGYEEDNMGDLYYGDSSCEFVLENGLWKCSYARDYYEW